MPQTEEEHLWSSRARRTNGSDEDDEDPTTVDECALAYVVFLTLYTYVVLVKMYPTPRWEEVYVTAFLLTVGIEKVREILASEPVTLSMKLGHWFGRLWNICDAIFIVTYLLAQPLRFQPSTFRWGRSIICCNNMYWHIRLFEIFSVEKYLGPMVTMVGKMLVKMLHFIILLVIILFSFGVLRQSIRFPNSEPSWYLLRHVFYQPYFMLYGEVYAPEIEPEQCGDGPGLEACEFWITVVAMAGYLLVANILMLNLMIAVFNNIFAGVNAVAHEVWMFQRYRLVMEYELRPVCPPPFIVFSHLYMLLKLCLNQCRRDSASYDRGLKLFLDEEALENVHDFEEECLEEYFRQKEHESQHKTERLVQQTWERQELAYQRLEDVLLRERVQVEATRLVDYRLKRLEEMFGGVERLARHTHLMLRQHTGLGGSEMEGLDRLRQVSSGSDDYQPPGRCRWRLHSR
ncbi:transient receptor potential cation channel trpm-like [Pollicipes pollicipes]|uniref:transient receptor potential cation channel trpm-like n=1 Tax=Pollicipes pollicipes TaxID=41117 RepID=UPI001884C5A2|nr:transient receptor potential cation channel trpm-like [Pollicipes pollicipes]